MICSIFGVIVAEGFSLVWTGPTLSGGELPFGGRVALWGESCPLGGELQERKPERPVARVALISPSICLNYDPFVHRLPFS